MKSKTGVLRWHWWIKICRLIGILTLLLAAILLVCICGGRVRRSDVIHRPSLSVAINDTVPQGNAALPTAPLSSVEEQAIVHELRKYDRKLGDIGTEYRDTEAVLQAISRGTGVYIVPQSHGDCILVVYKDKVLFSHYRIERVR